MAFTICSNVGEILLWETQIEICKQNLLLKVQQGNNTIIPPHFCERKLKNIIGCSFFVTYTLIMCFKDRIFKISLQLEINYRRQGIFNI